VTYNDPNLTGKNATNFESRERQSNAYSSSDGAEDFSFIKIKFRDCISLGGAQRKTNIRNSAASYLTLH
jgi:hypothetical protein